MSEDSPSHPVSPPEPASRPEHPAPPRRLARARSAGGVFHLPLWLRTTASLGIALALLVALVLYVEHHNTNSPPITNLTAEVRANQEAAILVSQDQAPHVARLTSGAAPAAALRHTVRAFMAAKIVSGAISGPLQRATCAKLGKQATGRGAFGCTVQAGGVEYQFRGVVDTRARQITYCKRDPPPVPSLNVPLNRRCLA